MKEYLLSVTQGDDVTYNLNFTDANGAVVDITGWTIFFTVKNSPEESADTNALISKTITSHTSPTSGLTTIDLSSTDTNIPKDLYYFDIQVKTNTGKIYTVMKGRFEVTYDITRRTS